MFVNLDDLLNLHWKVLLTIAVSHFQLTFCTEFAPLLFESLVPGMVSKILSFL